MKKIQIVFYIVTTLLHSQSSESKIIQTIFSSMYNNEVLSVYAVDQKKIDILHEAKLRVVKSCENATIAYISLERNACKKKPIFTDNYKTFKNSKNAIGAFYWSKGRPNIIFLQSRLKHFGLTLPQELKKYEMSHL